MSRRKILTLASIAAACITNRPASAQFDPPAGYYDSAVGTGSALKANLHDIIDGHTVISYSNREGPLEALWEDPANPNNVILVYSGYSIPKSDFLPGTTPANTEHLWPRSQGISSSGPDNSDLFNMRPCDGGVNSARGNEYFDDVGGSSPAHPQAPECRSDSSRWQPRPSEEGDIARAMFYMAVRYDGSESATTDLTLVNGTPGTNQLGDLASLLQWHYLDPISDAERQHNQTIYTDYQHNRNPFVDHPEFAWAIWGTEPNDSVIHLGASTPADGSSTDDVAFAVIRGVGTAWVPVTLYKNGADPTTYDIWVTGDVYTDAAGNAQAFPAGLQSREIQVGVADISTPGVHEGTVQIDNTDLTSAATGQGAADGDDVLQLTADVLDHAEASFGSATDQDSLNIDFGPVPSGSGIHTIQFSIHNLIATPSLTARLDLDAIDGMGDTSVLSTDLVTFTNLLAGDAMTFNASIDSGAPQGSYEAAYLLHVSDENLVGAVDGSPLVLTVSGQIAAAGIFPFDDDGDGDIDQTDADHFLTCVQGPVGSMPPSCFNQDADQDGDVDLTDYRALQIAFSP